MFKKMTFAGAALAMTAAAIAPTTANAQYYRDGYYGRGYQQQYQGYNGYDGYRTYRGYDRDYRYRNRCNSDTGTIVGAIAGGLLGNVIAGRGDRLLGTVIGGAGGALAGRAVEKSNQPGYCRR
ncbi:MAG: glycine zipper 2TM domain-containing protein [Sphingomonas sp.]|uniref:glycine zipper 2TM domain-containing protein n=1 Tax=Sphingomonas sp. TaxID=28214 RepID=UPI001AC2D634|nr:glycine zipper 2TM domain-containing protein [Sphingomonas sp.]MBN8808594.1 glycine zipper 2TM domain-containing protein [Sphingomonas sp.]